MHWTLYAPALHPHQKNKNILISVVIKVLLLVLLSPFIDMRFLYSLVTEWKYQTLAVYLLGDGGDGLNRNSKYSQPLVVLSFYSENLAARSYIS